MWRYACNVKHEDITGDLQTAEVIEVVHSVYGDWFIYS